MKAPNATGAFVVPGDGGAVSNWRAVVPNRDLVEHDVADNESCVCGPTVEPVKRDDGSVGWLYIHHSLDGRELSEREPNE